MEKNVPGVSEITMDDVNSESGSSKTATVNNITNQIVYGNWTNVANSGDGASLSVVVSVHDKAAVSQALEKAGIPAADAAEFAEIVASEKPETADQPFGPKAKAWLGSNLNKAVDGTWKVGIAVASKVLSEVAMQFYGVK